jgi:putative hydrolase of the HAD superfamily
MIEPRQIKGILFDVHDTLITKDYRAVEQGLRNSVATLQEAGYQVSYEEYVAAWRRAGREARRDLAELGEVDFEGWYRLIFSALGIREWGQGLMLQVNRSWNQAFLGATRVLPHTKAVLRRLKADYGLGIVSNSLAPNTLWDLTVTGLQDFFSAILISSEVGKRKPHPLIFQKGLQALGLRPSQALFVGDNLYEDILGAQQVGMVAVLITHPLVERGRRRWGNTPPDPGQDTAQPDVHIRDLRELLTLLEGGTRQ